MLPFRLSLFCSQRSPFQPNQSIKTDLGYRLGYDSPVGAPLFSLPYLYTLLIVTSVTVIRLTTKRAADTIEATWKHGTRVP
jgi:hypothetical protein